jgi:hypothetical protein
MHTTQTLVSGRNKKSASSQIRGGKMPEALGKPWLLLAIQ